MSTRACRTCGETKPLMDFYVNTKGTIDRDCKPCRCEKVRANRLVRIEQYRKYDRDRSSLPHRVEARQAYAETPDGKEAHLRAQHKYNRTEACRDAKKRYAERYPSKQKAKVICGNAIRDGRLKRQPCEVCGAQKAQAHHDDYSKPLDVRWLCTTHHAEWHKHNTPLCPEQEQAA